MVQATQQFHKSMGIFSWASRATDVNKWGTMKKIPIIHANYMPGIVISTNSTDYGAKKKKHQKITS